MAQPAERLHVVRAHLAAEELEWLRRLAEDKRLSEEEMLAELVRNARDRDVRQGKAREHLLERLGDAAELEPGEERAIRREIDGR